MISIVSAVTLFFLFFISVGKYVRIIASTTPSTMNIDCSLKDIYLLGTDNIESTEDTGDRLLVVKIFNGQNSLFPPIERSNVTNLLGYYVIDSPSLPGEVSLNSELRVVVQMFDSTGSLLAEDEKTVVYK